MSYLIPFSALALFLMFSGVLFFVGALQASKKGSFYGDTWFGLPWGIFVWGDGLVLAPFWFGVGAVALVFGLDIWFLGRLYLLFWAVRSAYEVIYWILHQASQKEYEPPLFRNITWLNADQAAILYQLLNMILVIMSVIGLQLL